MVRGLIPSWRPASLLEAPDGELLQHLAFAPRQRLAAGEMQRRGSRRGVLRLPARIGADRLIEPGHDFAAAERLFDEIQRAVLDRADRHGDVALAGDHEDRRRIVLAVKFLQDIEAGFAGNVHVEQDAGRRPGARDRQQCGAVGKTDHLIAARRQHHRQACRERRGRRRRQKSRRGKQGLSAMCHRPSIVKNDAHSPNGTHIRYGFETHPYLYGTKT